MPRFINVHATKRREKRYNAIKFQNTDRVAPPTIVTPNHQRKENVHDEPAHYTNGVMNTSFDDNIFEFKESPSMLDENDKMVVLQSPNMVAQSNHSPTNFTVPTSEDKNVCDHKRTFLDDDIHDLTREHEHLINGKAKHILTTFSTTNESKIEELIHSRECSTTQKHSRAFRGRRRKKRKLLNILGSTKHAHTEPNEFWSLSQTTLPLIPELDSPFTELKADPVDPKMINILGSTKQARAEPNDFWPPSQTTLPLIPKLDSPFTELKADPVDPKKPLCEVERTTSTPSSMASKSTPKSKK